MMHSATQSGFAAALKAPSSEGLARGMAVYRNNRRAALIESLSATYFAVARIVGRDFFAGLANEFIAVHPPHSPVLQEYGGELPGFIDAYGPAAALPYLSDVARLEWAWICAYHAADVPALHAQALGGLDDETLMAAKICLHPSLGYLRSAHPAGTIWEMNREGGTPEPVPSWHGQDVLVLRPARSVIVQVLSPGGWEFLDALTQGLCLGEAIEAAAAQHSAFDAAAHLAGLFDAGAIAGLKIAQAKEASSDD